MNKSINLVSEKKSYLESEQRILAILRGISISLLITVAIVSVVTFVIGAAIPLSSIKQQENSIITSIASLHKRLATFNYTKDRINNIQNLISERKDLTKPFNTILSIFPSNARINSISIDKGILQITISSNSLIDMNQFINDMYDLSNKKTTITEVKLDSLNLNGSSGLYSLSMEAKIL